MATNLSAINIGQSQQSLSHVSQYDSEAMQRRVCMLMALGFTDFRVAASTFDYLTGVDISLMIARDIISLGGKVSVGLTTGGHANTQALWDTKYVPAVLQFARVAKILGVESIYVGNEEEWKTTLNASQVRTNIVTLLNLVAPIVSGTPISLRYDVGQDAQWLYIQNGIGGFELGLNVYGTDGDTTSFANHITQTKNGIGREKLRITEWHLHHVWNQIPQATRDSETLLRDKIMERVTILREADVKQAYAFTTDWADQGDQFAYIKSDGKFRLCFNEILPTVPPAPPPPPLPETPTHSILISDGKYCRKTGEDSWFNPLFFTMSLWYKSLPQLASRVLQIKGSAALFEIEHKGVTDNRLLFELRNDQGAVLLNNVVTTDGLSDGAWHNLIVTGNNGELKVYKDNTLIGVFDFTPSGTFTFDRSAIGSHCDYAYQYNQGNYCYFKYWDSVLSESDRIKVQTHALTTSAPIKNITLSEGVGLDTGGYTLSNTSMWSIDHP